MPTRFRYLKWITIIFLFVEIISTCYIYSKKRLDGDIATIVLPIGSNQEVLKDPFGLQAAIHHKKYSGPNRWFCHQSMRVLFIQVANTYNLFIKDKVLSIYLANMTGYLVAHLLLFFALFLYASVLTKKLNINALFVIITIIPFFHGSIFSKWVMLVDNSVTYTIFYTFPLAIALLYFYPFYKSIVLKQLFWRPYHWLGWIFLAYIVAFSSPFNPVIGILVSVGIFLFYWRENFSRQSINNFPLRILKSLMQIPPHYFIFLFLFSLMCLYAIYVGTFNIENVTLPLNERYKIFFQFLPSYFISVPFLVVAFTTLYALEISSWETLLEEQRRQIKVLCFLIIIMLVYVFLIPFGGYRSYRPEILRGDITMPLTVVLVVICSTSMLFSWENFKSKPSKKYLATLLFTGVLFWSPDKFNISNNKKQKEYLYKLSQHEGKEPLLLPKDETIISWSTFDTPEQGYYISKFLEERGITKGFVPFYQQ